MSVFKVNDKLWQSLTPEQQAELRNDLDNNLPKVVEAKTNENLELEKTKLLEKIKQEQEQEKVKNDFLSSVPEKNKQVVNDLLATKTQDEIKNSYSHLLTNDEPKKFLDLESIIEGTAKRIKEADLETDEAFKERIKNEGLSAEASDEEWERHSRLFK